VTPEQNKKFRVRFLSLNMVIAEDLVVKEIDIAPKPTDYLRGQGVVIYPASLTLCQCGRPECKGQWIETQHYMVMN
jgi:hypothetical protein